MQKISWQQITGLLLALPLSLHATTTPSLCWHYINLQNVICGAQEPGAFLKLLHFSIRELLKKKLPIFMLFFSSYNRFGNNWGTQLLNPWKICSFFHRVPVSPWLYIRQHLNQTRANGLTMSKGGTLAPLSHAFFFIPLYWIQRRMTGILSEN